MYKYTIPLLIATFTNHPRIQVVHGVDFEWSDSLVHTIFRVWELIAWRREGMRCEMTSSVLGQQPHTFEALCGIVESMVRSLKFSFKIVRVPALVTPQGVLFPSFYSFAIAVDATATNTPPTTFTWNHTCTGSNLILFVAGFGPGDISAFTYNSVSGSQTRAAVSHDGGFGAHWYLAGPSTGTNSLVLVAGISGAYVSVSYSGASQTGIPDASNTASGLGVSTLSVTVTTSADNCWVFGCAGDSNGAGTTSAGAAPTTLRISNNTAAKGFDNGAAKTPAGGVTLQLNDSSGAANLYWIAASFAPAGGGGGGGERIPSAFQLLGVGS